MTTKATEADVERNARELDAEGVELEDRPPDILYTVEEVPPWYLCILLGFQHYLTAFGGIVSVPLILSKALCVAGDNVGLSQLIGTIFFTSGLSTLLQTTIGVRLPIIQGGTFTFLVPTFAILSLTSCPYTEAEQGIRNITDLPPYGSEGHREIWQVKIREIQGAIMVASLFQVVIGYSGLMGVIMRYIGPLAVTPTVSLIGLSLYPEAAELASKQWYIALMTIALIALFSQYLRNVEIPVCRYHRKDGCGVYKLPLFKLFPVMLAMIIAWIICTICSAAGAFPDDANGWGYAARTDTKTDALHDAAWFRFPYPGQWGTPTVNTAAVFGMLAGVLSSMIESVGDYFACARLSGAPPPPDHAITRGIGIEGVACILAGAWGSGSGTTSYSENIGAIGITKVGSRRVVQVGGVIMLILGCLGKFGALFVTIPDPVVGGMFLVTFGMVVAVGLTNLQFVDLNSSRNIFILGVSFFFGLSFPVWVKGHTSHINTGNDIVDQIIAVLLSTSMLVGGVIGFVLDNTIPGTNEERGIEKWRAITMRKPEDSTADFTTTTTNTTYDIPLIQKYLNRWAWPKCLPFCPSFNAAYCVRCCRSNEPEEPRSDRTASNEPHSFTNKAFDAEPSKGTQL